MWGKQWQGRTEEFLLVGLAGFEDLSSKTSAFTKQEEKMKKGNM